MQPIGVVTTGNRCSLNGAGKPPHAVRAETPSIKTVGCVTDGQAKVGSAMLILQGSRATREESAQTPMASARGDRDLLRRDVLRILHTSVMTAVTRAIMAAISFAWVPRAHAASTQSICSELDDDAVHNAGGPLFEVSVGPAGFDSWCPVTVRASLAALDELQGDSIEYVWLKDASSPKARRIYASRKASAESTAVELTQALKSGYRARPLLYCSKGGVFEGEVFTVP